VTINATSGHGDTSHRSPAQPLATLAVLTEQLGRCGDLDEVLTVSLEGLAGLFGFDHSMLLMLDETGTTLYTIASRGYERAGIGSEISVGVGIIGMVAAQNRPMRIGNLDLMMTYARAVRRGNDSGACETEIPLPGLPNAASQLAAPATVMGQLLGVLAVERERVGAFSPEDESLLAVVAHLVASAIELDRIGGRALVNPTESRAIEQPPSVVPEAVGRVSTVKFYPVDGSTFIDGQYLIKGVAGRILWRLLRDHAEHGRSEFTNREVRLDPSLEMPAFRDNLESRLILLQRRLEERQAPIRIHKSGRGRFRLSTEVSVRLERSGEA
jgi:adenylate cyclase